MDDDEPAIVSGDIETIVIKPESIELLFNNEDSIWSEEDLSEDYDFELASNSYDQYCYVTSSGEVIAINIEDIVQTPFYLENYFLDYYELRSDLLSSPNQQLRVVVVDRITCYECDIVFCNEHKLLEHLMLHIDVYRMGCDVCDKDLNLEEKFQLHSMAVTWQSIYYCDFCRKSCAGVVRSKSQPPPPGKTYMCHDCEYRKNQEMTNFQSSAQFYKDIVNKPTVVSMETPQVILPPPLPALPSSPPLLVPHLPPAVSAPPPPAEVLQDHKQKPNNETKYEEYEFYSTENSNREVQDCRVTRKSPPKKKENKKCRRPKPKVQIVNESVRQTLRMSTRSHAKREKNKIGQSYRCRYCPMVFTENYVLISHLHEKHEFQKLRYVCKLCGKDFMQQRSYQNHLHFHQLAKNHMCFVCNLAFHSKFELEQHVQMHNRSEIMNNYCDSPENVALDLRKKKRKSAA